MSFGVLLSRRCWCFGLLIGTAIFASPAGAQRNNVLLVLADDVGIEKVGAYGVGPAPAPTPNIDALAANGVLFRNAWADPLCSPTRAGIQTGRHAFRTGVGFPKLERSGVLRYEETTIPELLDAAGAGYAHGAFGKWHLSDARNGGIRGPNLAGWSHYAGALNGVANYYSWQRIVNGVTTRSTVYHTTQTVDDALAWIRSVPEPWVCYVAFTAAHSPYHNPPAHLHTYQLGPSPRVIDQYKAMVQSLDTELGRLLAGLGSQRANTEVIFASDNGTPYGLAEAPFPATRAKGTPYQGGVLVPMIVSGPSVQSPGREVDAVVGTVDLFATIARMCGVDPQPPSARIDSVSMMPYLTDPDWEPRRSTLLAEQFWTPAGEPQTTQWAFRDQRYKLIHISRRPIPEELYDLATDPWETNNLLARPLTAAESARYVALQTGAALLRDPPPSVTTYGVAGCPGTNGQPAIGWEGVARLGATYTVSLKYGAPTLPALLVVGGSSTRFAGGDLPFPLASLGGAPGCYLYASTEFVLPTTVDGMGRASISFTVPSEPVLLAGSLYHSWLLVDPDAPLSMLGLTSSNGLEVTLAR